jgi:3-deoxy-D-manno-octulosonate 8-phosphate phosphatase (KDO 8-P phosphatase)
MKEEKTSLIVLDVDGVLTNGSVVIGPDGKEIQSYNILDGLGIRLAQLVDIKIAIISSRATEAVKARASNLSIDIIRLGVNSKKEELSKIVGGLGIGLELVCYIGDDLADYNIMKEVGIPIAVENAVQDIKSISKYVTTKKGGEGAVREAIEWLLVRDCLLDTAKSKYLDQVR